MKHLPIFSDHEYSVIDEEMITEGKFWHCKTMYAYSPIINTVSGHDMRQLLHESMILTTT